jgi:hypothetical protein
MKVQLVKGETKETFGEGENAFDYWFRPLTLEEKQNVNSGIAWKTGKGKTGIDFAHTDVTELVRLAVTKIDRLYDSDDQKIDTIEKLLALKSDAGFIDGVLISMWITVWMSMSLTEDIKKKLSRDSTATAQA